MSDTQTVEPPAAGDNSLAAAGLKSFVERIESLEEEKATLAEDIKDVFKEATAAGLDTLTVKRAIMARRKDPKVRKAEEDLLRLYLKALGVK